MCLKLSALVRLCARAGRARAFASVRASARARRGKNGLTNSNNNNNNNARWRGWMRAGQVHWPIPDTDQGSDPMLFYFLHFLLFYFIHFLLFYFIHFLRLLVSKWVRGCRGRGQVDSGQSRRRLTAVKQWSKRGKNWSKQWSNSGQKVVKTGKG